MSTSKKKRVEETETSSSTAQAPLTLEQNPLLIDLVLERVVHVGNWDVTDLKNFRLVCKLWKDASLNVWRSKATLCLTQARNLPAASESKGLMVTHFLELCNNSDYLRLTGKPFSKYKLYHWRIDLKMRGCTVQDLWNRIGTSVQSLHFDHCTFEEPAVESVKYLLFDETPNLKQIIFTETEKSFGKVRRPFTHTDKQLEMINSPSLMNHGLTSLEIVGKLPILMNNRPRRFDFLAKFPNLKYLKVGTGRRYKERGHSLFDYWKFYNTLREHLLEQGKGEDQVVQLIGPPFPTCITSLDVMDIEPVRLTMIDGFRSFIEFVNGLQLPLKEFSAQLEIFPGNPAVITQLFKNYAGSLEILKLFRPPFDKCRTIQPLLCPNSNNGQMSAMKELHFWGNVSQGFWFVYTMPSLEVVTIDYSCYTLREKWSMLKNLKNDMGCDYKDLAEDSLLAFPWHGNDLGLRMNKLTHFSVDRIFNNKCLRALSTVMPNLRTLKTILTKETFPVVCERWQHLTELTLLFGSDVDDSIVTGIEIGNEEKIRSPNITNMKYLAKFTLQTYCDKGKLTDFSAYNGFLQLSFLHTLHIGVARDFKLEGESLLKEQICQVRVIRNHETDSDQGHECCDRRIFENWMLSKASRKDKEKIKLITLR